MSVRSYGPHGMTSVLLFLLSGILYSYIILQTSLFIEYAVPFLNSILSYIGRNSLLILAFHVILFQYMNIVEKYLLISEYILSAWIYQFTKVILNIGCILLINKLKESMGKLLNSDN